MFNAALITIAKMCQQPKSPSKDKWINKLCYIHTVEYYSAIIRKEVLMRSTAYMNLENMMLSERSQTQKVTCHMIPCI